MLRRIKNSLAFRFPVLVYKKWLTYFSHYQPQDKPAAEFNYVVLCGKDHYPFLKQVIISIQKKFSQLPHLYTFVDFGFPESQIKNILALYPSSKISVLKAEECVKYHLDKNNVRVSEFASKNPMGLKLAAILQIADNRSPLIYTDTDVLWLKDPIDDISNLLKDDLSMHMSYDYQPGYDFDFIAKAGLEGLLEPPYYCAGLMLIKEIDAGDVDTINKLLPYLIEKSEHLSEQTLFAHLQKQKGKSALFADKYVLSTTGQFDLRYSVKDEWIARHYIGPVRHLFWRDAFYI
ncbi:hypothetical protein CKK33_16425 [Mucilaginibacter sp. MD40]|uniref:putative nucleotide-diphospho-sugar transferase n=1 Tax=Mucilaginibacter sp. MD40 TaxID=2029590 RepID=UPI000BAC68A2|nr:putative nucleotide-diphospho-sugar transferase [Mucilaginibacter sp. MD40]PAW94998.1 hypothetical protein CKK33_16425 [Mucilaginibacter sp. MD40]